MIWSYPSVYEISHPAVKELLNGYVAIQEKVDGSQFSFGVFNGELMCRSKGKMLDMSNPEKMFTPAVDYLRTVTDKMSPSMVYRCEYLRSPRHNTLEYDRIPKNHLMLFDVETSPNNFIASPQYIYGTANNLGIEAVKTQFVEKAISINDLRACLTTESQLGKSQVEGWVVKSYEKSGPDKKILCGKLVRPDFKEKNDRNWKQNNPTQTDIVRTLIDTYRNENRWEKAIQHLRDNGELTGTMRDMGPLTKEVITDIEKEDADTIKEFLWEHYWPKMRRGVVAGLPEFYKRRLEKE